MMTYLHIQGFRSLQDLRLTGLTRVNLLLGAHGVGKTSALEAIALWARAGALRASLFRPGESSRDDLDVRHLFHGRVLGTQEIRVTAEWSPPDGGAGTPAEVRIRHVPSMTGTTLPVLRIRAGDQEQEVPLASDGTLPSGFPMHSKPFAQSLAVATGWAVFHAGAALVAADMVRPLAEMVPREEEADILQLVQMADPTITAICARDDGVMHVTQDGQAVPLASVGEGVRRLLLMAMAVASLPRGSIVLLDNIDYGLSAGPYCEIASSVLNYFVEAGQRRDVMVFATAHSKEWVEAVVWLHYARPSAAEHVSVHRLEKGGRMTRRFSAVHVDTLVGMGLDVRWSNLSASKTTVGSTT